MCSQVLATDMVNHFSIMGDFNGKVGSCLLSIQHRTEVNRKLRATDGSDAR